MEAAASASTAAVGTRRHNRERGRRTRERHEAEANALSPPCFLPSFLPSFSHSLTLRWLRFPHSDHIDVVLLLLGLALFSLPCSTERSSHPQTGFANVAQQLNYPSIIAHLGPSIQVIQQKRPSRLRKDETKASSSTPREKREQPAGSHIARKQHFAFARSPRSLFNQESISINVFASLKLPKRFV